MDVLTELDLGRASHTLRARLLRGDVAILPTDTIYGLSGDALDLRVVRRIARIKRRDRPPTVIPHDVEWALSLVRYDRAAARTALELRRGDTLLFPYRPPIDGPGLPAPVVASGLVSFRRPRHWITDLARDLGRPLVSTSVNRTTEAPMTSLDDLDPRIAAEVDLLVYQGTAARRPSTLVFFDQAPPREVRR